VTAPPIMSSTGIRIVSPDERSFTRMAAAYAPPGSSDAFALISKHACTVSPGRATPSAGPVTDSQSTEGSTPIVKNRSSAEKEVSSRENAVGSNGPPHGPSITIGPPGITRSPDPRPSSLMQKFPVPG